MLVLEPSSHSRHRRTLPHDAMGNICPPPMQQRATKQSQQQQETVIPEPQQETVLPEPALPQPTLQQQTQQQQQQHATEACSIDMSSIVANSKTKPLHECQCADDLTDTTSRTEDTLSIATESIADSSSNRRHCRLSFGRVDIHSHPVTLSRNPSVSDNLPIELGWESSSSVSFDVDEYERLCAGTRRKSPQKIPLHDRKEWLLNRGYSKECFQEVSEEIELIKESRRRESDVSRLSKQVDYLAQKLLAKQQQDALDEYKRLANVSLRSSRTIKPENDESTEAASSSSKKKKEQKKKPKKSKAPSSRDAAKKTSTKTNPKDDSRDAAKKTSKKTKEPTRRKAAVRKSSKKSNPKDSRDTVKKLSKSTKEQSSSRSAAVTKSSKPLTGSSSAKPTRSSSSSPRKSPKTGIFAKLRCGPNQGMMSLGHI